MYRDISKPRHSVDISVFRFSILAMLLALGAQALSLSARKHTYDCFPLWL